MIELENSQKIQLGFVVLLLGAAAFYLAWNWNTLMGRTVDTTINAWGQKQEYGQNPKQPISPTNPLDTTKTTFTDNFIIKDGALTITEYPGDPARAAIPDFIPDRRIKHYFLYVPDNTPLMDISNTTRRALVWAARAFPRAGAAERLARDGDLTDDEKKAERAARQTCIDTLNSINIEENNGSGEPQKYQAMLDALTQYKANPDDPTKSSAKKALGYKVIHAAMAYLKAINADRTAAIDTYVSAVEGIANDDQKKKIAQAMPVWLQNKS